MEPFYQMKTEEKPTLYLYLCKYMVMINQSMVSNCQEVQKWMIQNILMDSKLALKVKNHALDLIAIFPEQTSTQWVKSHFQNT
jgi:hypothetical protein